MKTLSILALAALAAPVAYAQTYYYPRNDYPLAREELRDCMARDDTLAARQADLEAEKRMNDREAESIARANATLADELRRVDPADAAAVAAHNARTADHNARVDAHNLRVNDQNAAARRLNSERADFQSSCGSRTYWREDRDAILYSRRY
jgi:hypothetical protein